jgi:hypothetical protein
MRKTIVLIGFILTLNTSCEKDDFCLQNPVTPNLVLRFYDDANRETLKSVRRFSMIAESKTDSLFTNQSADSIAIPLNSTATKTVYILKMNNEDGTKAKNQIAKFTIEYTSVEEYVSRSCGYKILFKDLTFSADNAWIKDFTPATLTTIDNQNTAHVQIFY